MTKYNQNKKRKLRNRKKLKSVSNNKFRISVFKSLKNISAQLIDDNINKTLVSASSSEKDIRNKKMKKKEVSVALAELFANRVKEKKINSIYFDRGQYKYHGRIKDFADSLRKNGLKF
tara:strand:+ start:686 stop:1039 length:354 start_codon:yes stop_codon:yes gene_type:complete